MRHVVQKILLGLGDLLSENALCRHQEDWHQLRSKVRAHTREGETKIPFKTQLLALKLLSESRTWTGQE